MSVDLVTLLDLSVPKERTELFASVLPTILDSIAQVAAILNKSHHVTLAGTANDLGDDQLNVDVAAELVIRHSLSLSPSIVTVSSEEDPVEKNMATAIERKEEEQYTVAFDPLDGSSIIGANWTVGAIFGVWEGDTAVGVVAGEKQVAAVLGVLGPRTTAIVAVKGAEAGKEYGKGFCFEVGLMGGTDGKPKVDVIRPSIKLAAPPFKTCYYAPANLRCAAEFPAYRGLIDHYITAGYTLRYAGGLVPDVAHILSKGHGVYVNPVTLGTKAKLRALYELFPIALVVECVGGKAVRPEDGKRILDGQAEGCGDKGAFLFGTAEEVDFAVEKLVG